VATIHTDTHLKDSLAHIRRLLDRHRLLDTLARRQEGPKRDLVEGLQRRQNLAEVHKRVNAMHGADVAYVLEALPPSERQVVWEQLKPTRAGEVFVEVSDAVREWLVDATPKETLTALLATLDADDLRYVRDAVPAEVLLDVGTALDSRKREEWDESVPYDEAQVGRHMTRDAIAVPETHMIQDVLGDAVAQAVAAFERYDLVSSPVVDDRGKLVGRLTVDTVMDLARTQADQRALAQAGLTRDEDLFASPWDSARNRWPWLGVNLVTAFLASRVIGQFEDEIRGLAALAALMPIVASIGGNTGNQTMALMIRALAVDQVRVTGVHRLLKKEMLVSVLNGSVWGLLIGLVAVALYSSLALGAVMTAAVVLNLFVAAVVGVVIPFVLHSAGRDPAFGSSVLLTFVTDAMGFFFFLALAGAFLL
jgi:magnesium transporter